MIQTENPGSLDVVLIGAGIMSATVGTMLKELEPSLKITVFETLEDSGQESSQAWNNAGTGHAANCELNYKPQRADGSVDISEALKVNTEFDLSRQLWSYLIGKGAIPDPRAFIHPCPHMGEGQSHAHPDIAPHQGLFVDAAYSGELPMGIAGLDDCAIGVDDALVSELTGNAELHRQIARPDQQRGDPRHRGDRRRVGVSSITTNEGRGVYRGVSPVSRSSTKKAGPV
jgi:hypothetical protein